MKALGESPAKLCRDGRVCQASFLTPGASEGFTTSGVGVSLSPAEFSASASKSKLGTSSSGVDLPIAGLGLAVLVSDCAGSEVVISGFTADSGVAVSGLTTGLEVVCSGVGELIISGRVGGKLLGGVTGGDGERRKRSKNLENTLLG